MADIPVKIYRSSQVRPNTSPTNPSFPADQDPVIENPSGTTVTTYKALGDTLDTSFIGKNGFTPIVVNESDLQLIPLAQVQENGLISGGIVQWTGNGYEFNISSAIYRIGGNNYASPASIKTLATPDATNDRIDVFAVDVNNEVVVITGTPATTPIKPQVNPATQLELTSVIVTAASTTPTLTDEVVYDENTEWTGTSSGTGTANFASTTSPYQGTVSIETTNIQDGFTIILDNGSDFDLGTVQTFGFQIKLKAAMPAGQNILFSLLDASNNPIAKPITIQIDKGITTYQFSGLILSSLGLLTNLVRKVRFGFLRTGGSPTFAGYFLDIVKFEGGINPPVNISNHNSLNGLQGGNATERYHLTKNKAEAAEAANAPTSSNPFATTVDLDDYVPYSGATQDVDLGAQGITTEWIKLNTTPVIPTDQGSLYWDEDDNVLAVVLNGAIQKVGEVTFYNVKNQTGSTIPKGTGVGFAGVVGASGRIKVAPFLANGSQPSIYYVGITAEAILNGEDGKVYNFGPIRGLNTSAFSEGDVLYASSTVAGGFTTTPPTAPNNVIVVAAVLTDSATVGALLVRVTVSDLGGGTDTNKVSYNAADSKNATERNQARVNIGSTSATPQVIATAGAINDLTVTSNSLVFTGASVVLSGIVAGLDGEEIAILNASGTTLQLLAQSTLSTDANRFLTGIVLADLSIVRIKYRATTARWVLDSFSKWNSIGDDIFRNSSVVIGSSSLDSNLDTTQITSKTSNATGKILNVKRFDGTSAFYVLQGSAGADSRVYIQDRLLIGPTVNAGFNFFLNSPLTSDGNNYARITNGNNTVLFNMAAGGLTYFTTKRFDIGSDDPTNYNGLRVTGGSTTLGIFLVRNSSSVTCLEVFGTGRVFHAQSGAANESVRRDELPYNYPETVTTSGTINDLALANEGVKLLILTLADDLTGVVPVTTNTGRLLRIEGRNATGVIIRHDSASSTAANRFSIGSDLTIANGEIYTFIYTNARWRRVL